MKKHQTVLIYDMGGKYCQLIARRLREQNVYCEIAAHTVSADAVLNKGYAGIILSGGDESIEADRAFLKSKVPVMAVGSAAEAFGAIARKVTFADVSGEIVAAPVEIIFYPELTLQPGAGLIETFCKACKTTGDWNMSDFAQSEIEELANKYSGKKILCALSGGVDSSVCAVLLSKAVGKNLTCIFVDHGVMRKNEPEEVNEFFAKQDMNFIMVDARDRFLGKLAGVTDPEKKRKIIGEEFIRVFEEEAQKIGEVDYLVQGTIYPDIIESGIGKAAVIKSHHNVGGLPKNIKFKGLIEPLKYLFKAEVRELGRVLGLDERITGRQPFPGPGIAVRIMGEVTAEKVRIVQDADYIFRQEIAAAGLNGKISQFFAALTNIKSVGIKDGQRTYEYAVALRAITTTDFMTADFYRIPHEILARVSARIVTEVENVSRVLYDITTKPPATIEFE